MTKEEFETLEADTSKTEEQKCLDSREYFYIKYWNIEGTIKDTKILDTQLYDWESDVFKQYMKQKRNRR